MDILRGRLGKRKMAKFAGVKVKNVDRSLSNLANLGYLGYKKVKGGKYQFILYPEPVKEIRLNQWPVTRP